MQVTLFLTDRPDNELDAIRDRIREALSDTDGVEVRGGDNVRENQIYIATDCDDPRQRAIEYARRLVPDIIVR